MDCDKLINNNRDIGIDGTQLYIKIRFQNMYQEESGHLHSDFQAWVTGFSKGLIEHILLLNPVNKCVPIY